MHEDKHDHDHNHDRDKPSKQPSLPPSNLHRHPSVATHRSMLTVTNNPQTRTREESKDHDTCIFPYLRLLPYPLAGLWAHPYRVFLCTLVLIALLHTETGSRASAVPYHAMSVLSAPMEGL